MISIPRFIESKTGPSSIFTTVSEHAWKYLIFGNYRYQPDWWVTLPKRVQACFVLNAAIVSVENKKYPTLTYSSIH